MKEKNKLLNLFDVFSLGLGGAIGSGIFVLLGTGIAYTGRSIVLVVSIGCVFMLLAYAYNLVVASMFPLKGGTYSQKALMFNPQLTGLSAVFTYLQGFAFSMYAIAIVEYASIIFPGILPYTKIIAIIIMTLFFATGIGGSKLMAVVNNIMTIILVLSIGLYIVVGLPQVQAGYFNPNGFFLNGWKGFFSAIAIMAWACQGTTMAPVAVAAETKDPLKTVPKAILLIVVALAVIYGLMSIVAAGVLPIEEVAGQNLSITAKQIFPNSVFVVFILGGAVFALATSLMSSITMMLTPTQMIAEDGWLPAVFKKTTKGGYPYVSQGVFYLFAIIPIIFDFSLDAIISLVMIPTMLLNMYLNFACIKLTKDYPEHWKKSILHMPKPIFSFLMVLSSVCAGIVAYNLFKGMQPGEMIAVCVMLALCIAVALIRLKTGAVDVDKLEANKKRVVEEALNS